MNTAPTPLLLLVTLISAGAFASVACSSAGGSTASSQAGASATTTATAASEANDAGASDAAETMQAAAAVVDADGGTDAAPAANCNDAIRPGTNICTSVLDGGTPPNGCLDTGGCYDFMYNLTPNVFAEAATCVGQISACQAGNPAIMSCLTKALSGACLDPGTASYCAQISAAEASCTKGTPADAGSMPECQQLLSGFTKAGRESFVKCAAESCADPSVVSDCLTFVMSEAAE